MLQSGDYELSCCCCFQDKNLYSLLLTYKNQETETYANIIQSCFGIQIFAENDDFKNNSYLICQTCVMRLKDALLLRRQVETAQIFFQENFANSKIRELNQSFIISSDGKKFNSESDDDFNNTSFESTNYNCEELHDNTIEPNETQTDVQMKLETKELDNVKRNNEISISDKIKTRRVRLTSSCRYDIILKKAQDRALSQNNKRYRCETITERFGINENDLTCKICNETFNYHYLLLTHMTIHSNEHICELCGKTFITNGYLQKHLTSHSNTFTNSCKVCNKKFKSNIALSNHMRIHETGSRMFNKCTECPKRFKHFHLKMKHMAEVHNIERTKYKCKLCPKEFSLSGGLLVHVKTFHLQHRNFKCPECDKCFYSRNMVKTHMISHSDVKNFQCEVCSKFYARRKTLKEHMKIHNNVKDYVCPICNRAFTQNCTLKGHMKVHKEDIESELDSF